MGIDFNDLQEIAYEYDFPIGNIVDYYERIKNYPFVLARDEQSLIDCLYLIVQDRVSNSFIISQYDGSYPFKDYLHDNYKSVEDSINDALYRIYDEEAIPYLSEKYLNHKSLVLRPESE